MISIEDAQVVDLSDIISRAPEMESNLRHCISLYLHSSVFTWCAKVDDKVACIWGLIPPSLISDRAYLWLQTTDLVEKHKFLFIRHSQIHMQKMLEKYPIIIGNVDTRFPNNIRWLKFLGAEFTDPIGFGVPFVIRKK